MSSTSLRIGSPVVAMAALLPSLLTAQTSELVLEVGGSQVRPPVDVEGPASTFLVGGLRASRFGATGSGAYAAFLSGRAMSNGTAGDFLSAELGAELWKPVATGWSAGTEVRAFGFDVTDPFPYRAGGVEGNVGVRLSRAAFSAQVSGVGGWGRSRVELSRYVDGPSRVMTDELWRYGGTVEILAGGGAVAVGGGAGLHRSTGGTYRSLGGRLVFGSGGTAVEVRADAWHTPGGTETTGGIALVIPFGGAWSLRGFLGRSEPDPLTLAEPGRAGGGMLLGRRLAGSGPRFPTRSESLYEVLDAGPVEARLRFSLPSPVARSVEILGDFTHWKPIDMARTDDRWVVDLSVPAGTHHFGFLVDGEWFVPEDAPHTVPDEWGRRNATLVVESNDPPVSANSVAEGAVR